LPALGPKNPQQACPVMCSQMSWEREKQQPLQQLL
jgi:hypothetical protein